MSRSPATPLHAQLTALHSDLLDLHKALIDHERTRYEKDRPKIPHPGEFLRLLLEDPFFQWLRTLSGLIVQIDEYLESKTPTTPDDGTALLHTARTLLTPISPATDPFHQNLARALTESTIVAAAHARYLSHNAATGD